MEGDNEIVFVVVFLLLVLVFLFKGVKQTFQRNAVVAILALIFLPPIFLVWAFVELFLDKPEKVQKVIIIEKEKE